MREEALFILRLWRDGDSVHAWRASLKDIHTRQTSYFADLDTLFAFVEERTAHQVTGSAVRKAPDEE